MVILSYIIPKDLQKNSFVQSLHKQFEEKGELSRRQTHALEDILEIELDFFGWSFEPPKEDEHICQEWDLLLAKMTRNRFRKIKNKNKCIRAMETIINGEPNYGMINDALGRNFQTYRRWY
jgi:tRNA U34 5-carboxymethylaminomethyl modifying GTPase MnmE/TrmE